MPDRLLPSSETCETLGISRSALGQWMDKGWIEPHQQLGNGAYLFTETEVARARNAAVARVVARGSDAAAIQDAEGDFGPDGVFA